MSHSAKCECTDCQEKHSLQAEIERLRAELAKYKSGELVDAYGASLEIENAHLEAENKQLREGLRRYGRHDNFCSASLSGCTCNCGLAKLLEERE